MLHINIYYFRCFTQEIIFFREDLLKKMQRYLAVPLVLDNSPNGISNICIII